MSCDYWSNDENDPCGECGPCKTTAELRAEVEKRGEILRRAADELKALRARIEELETVNPELIPQHLLNEARADIVKLKTEVESKSSAADWWCKRANETVEERDKEKALVFKLTEELEERSNGVLVRDIR